MSWEIREGDALERLREMPDESVQCCVSSPPFWGLRDYGVEGQLGLEPTPEEYVEKLVAIFAEVGRVLRDDGTLWLNLGDSYARAAGNRTSGDGGPALVGRGQYDAGAVNAAPSRLPVGCKPKDLVGIPWIVALALRAQGWYLRRDIIWAKPNPMPESVTDRPTSAHEYLFLLSKSPRYFYDAEAIREPATYAGPNGAQGFARRTREEEKTRQDKQRGHGRRHDGFNDRWDRMSKDEQQRLGRNKRSVWTIATRPYPEAHFATFPPDLVEPCILAGTPEQSCADCGSPWQRLTETSYENPGNRTTNGPRSVERRHETAGFAQRLEKHVETTGFEPTCECDGETAPAVVLDPFAGAATTGVVASRHNRSFVGIELNPEYVELGRNRIRDDAPLLNVPSEAAA